ncbi:MAG: ElyC/SanA/YdcF family protein [Victivallales bacterium]|nr:ElyC/SanA/YdcF family protein [Victivallales bacterium]
MILKKFIGRIFFPLPVTLMLLGLGAWLVLARKSSPRRRRWGKWLLLGGIGYLLFISLTGTLWLNCLKRSYPMFRIDAQIDPAREYVIAVAGNGFIPDPALPEGNRFSDEMLLRLGEAGRIARLLQEKGIRCRIVVSQPDWLASEEQRLAALRACLVPLGIAAERIELVGDALNTSQEIKAFGRYSGALILVSSAFHIPRIMLLARKYRVAAIPAPVGVPGRRQYYPDDALNLVPSAEKVNDFRILSYELLGMLEAKLF